MVYYYACGIIIQVNNINRNRKFMSYKQHDSLELNRLFKGFQGAKPETAIFVFVGLDANFDADIEKLNIKTKLFEYLDDGVEFWQREGVHHPFMLPDYKGDGKTYHRNFSRIGFKPEEADIVSFVELLPIPTTGRSKLTVEDLMGDVNNRKHLDYLAEAVFNNGQAGCIFLSSQVRDLMLQTKLFPWLKKKPFGKEKDIEVLAKFKGKIVYMMYHFSCYGKYMEKLNRQIEQIRNCRKLLDRM